MDVVVNPERREWEALMRRAVFDDQVIAGRVERIVDQVRIEGDDALRRLSAEIDGVMLDTLMVSELEIQEAAEQVSDELKKALALAAENIRKFHTAELPAVVDVETMPGVRCVQKAIPIRRVGLYIPGGSAPLFSTVLMLAIPAQVVGCGETILCTPPNKQGGVAPEILYAASLCGIKRIFKVGGAQAVAAMAYGTHTIPRVDKIFGPGNRYVTKAKQMVSTSQVAIDMPAGPSEVMVLADESARAEFVAADLLSQAEHGPDSQVLLVTNSRAFADRVNHYLEEQLAQLPRREIARRALGNGRMVVMDDRTEMIAFANEYAAEHLIISLTDPWEAAAQITAAGSIFIGNYSPESAGDYASGTNHTLPTSGWAKAFSGVNIDSFVRKVTIQELSPAGLQSLGDTIRTMARAEGLDAHKKAVEVRLNTMKND